MSTLIDTSSLYCSHNRLLSDQFVNKNKDSNGLNYYPFSLTVELPPTGDHSVNGFMVPPQQVSDNPLLITV